MPKNVNLSKDVNNSNVQTPLFADETALVLTKESSEVSIRTYFEAVLKLSQSDNEFPVNLNDVWMLAYSEKGKAVRALRKEFIEGLDFQPLAQNGKRSSNGQFGGENKVDYYLSVPCLEYFIARKVRPVFEVYRQVFHKAVKKEITYTQREVRKLVNDAEHRASEAIAVAKELAKSSASMRSQYTTITRLYQDELLMKINLLSFIELHNLTNELNNYLK